MSKKTRNIIIIVAAFQFAIAMLLVALPQLVQAMPLSTQYSIQDRLPISVGFFERFGPEQPDALPAPSGVARAEPAADVPQISFVDATPTRQPTATPVASPTNDAIAESAVADDLALTATPLPPTPEPTPPPPTPTVAPTPLPDSVRLTGLSAEPQGFNNCGPTNLKVVLNFYGLPITQQETAAYLKPNANDRNVSPWQMGDYVNEETELQASVFSGGDMELLRELIAAGYPVIVEKGYDPSTTEGWYGHYLTLFGYDHPGRVFYAIDTYLGPFDGTAALESYANLSVYWQQFNYTFLVIYPPADEAKINAIVGEKMTSPQTMWQNAALRAQEDLTANPDNPFAWFNLGTSMTRLGELTGSQDYYQQGAEAFDTAREIGLPYRMLWYQFRPYLAYMRTGRYQDMFDLANATLETAGGRNVEETYLYRGWAYAFEGQTSLAIADMQKALELNTNFYPAQIALQSLGGS